MADAIIADFDESGRDKFGETLGHVDGAAGVVGIYTVKDATFPHIPERERLLQLLAKGLVGEVDVLVCPVVFSEHDGEGVESCTFYAVGEAVVAHELV